MATVSTLEERFTKGQAVVRVSVLSDIDERQVTEAAERHGYQLARVEPAPSYRINVYVSHR